MMGAAKENPTKGALYMRKWCAQHPEYREKQKEYYRERMKNPENVEKNRARAKLWAEKNKDKALERSRIHYENNREKYTKMAKAYILKNLEKHLEYQRRYQLSRRGKIRASSTEDVDYNAVIERCGNICGICGKEIAGKFHFDHIIPISKGGPHCGGNLQQAHPSCNLRKNAKLNFSLVEQV